MNKGEIVKRLVASRRPGCDFVYCVGDDRTDEDMFKVLRKSELADEVCFTCTIGSPNKKTYAQWHVSSPEDVIALLERMADITLSEEMQETVDDSCSDESETTKVSSSDAMSTMAASHETVMTIKTGAPTQRAAPATSQLVPPVSV
jgi:Trehalose-phosphatase